MPYASFRRQPVPQQYEQNLQTQTLPAPTRGIVQSENESFMLPGGAIVHDNWAPTMRGVKLRGGCEVWCTLPVVPVVSGFEYVSGNNQRMFAGQAAAALRGHRGAVLIKGGPDYRQLLRGAIGDAYRHRLDDRGQRDRRHAVAL